MALTRDDIALLLTERGKKQYGREAVSQLDHALQCALLAEEAGETTASVVAALLHDLGHLLAPAAAEHEARAPRHDDLHQYVALPFLRGVLPDAVLEPIRMHVDAKRYLCAVDTAYWATLSPASQHSLERRAALTARQKRPALPNSLSPSRPSACAATTTWPRCLGGPRRRCRTTWR